MTMNRTSGRRRRGFTLVEMMVVIVIIGILATVVIVNISGKSDTAKVKATEALLKQLGGQMELFKLNHNRYPENLNPTLRRHQCKTVQRSHRHIVCRR